MGKNQAIAGLVLSIAGVVLSFLGGWLSIIALPAAIVGLVLAVIGGKKLRAANQPNGIATAGMVVGIIATVFAAIFFFTCGVCVVCAGNALDDAIDAIEDIDEDAFAEAFEDALNQ